jgi:hypothetical protein
MSKERPILFSAPMVRAILEGRKTQTRRAVKFEWSGSADALLQQSRIDPAYACRHGSAGDLLWVRETWRPSISHSCGMDSCDCADVWVEYPAGGEGRYFSDHDIPEDWTFPRNVKRGKNVPSIFMPRWASRILLEIASVRVERLQDINNQDAMAEGMQRTTDGHACHVENEAHRATYAIDSFASLWESINGPDSWEANPWVWVIEFKVVKHE